MMKRVSFVAVLLAALAVLLPEAIAQQKQNNDKEQGQMEQGRGMRRGQRKQDGMGMMHGMHGMRPEDCPACPTDKIPSPAGWLLEQREELGLSEEQVERLREMDTEFRSEQIDRRSELQKAMVEVRELMQEADVDPEELRERLEAMSGAGIDLITAWVENRKEALDVLDEEQKQMAGRALGGVPMAEAPEQREEARTQDQPGQQGG